jgi:hypothetical protein
MTIALQIEGPGANQAAGSLARIPGLSISVETADELGKEKDLLTTATAIATIIGAAGGVATIADQILSWRDRWAKARRPSRADQGDDGPQVEKIVLVIEERRVLLDDVSAETLARALRRVANPDE